MVNSWRGALWAVLLLVILPAVGAEWIWTSSFRDLEARADADARSQMEDVLHRLLRDSQPEWRARGLVERSLFRIRRGIPPERALRRVLVRLGDGFDVLLFDARGNPLPLPGHPVVMAAARRRLFASVDQLRDVNRLPSKTEEKLSLQILGDGSGINTLAGSRGHFRKFGTPTRYSHGAWWRLRVGSGAPRDPVRFNLLVLMKARRGRRVDPLRQLVRRVAPRLRGRFRLALVGPVGSPSFRRLPPDLRRAIPLLPGGQGEWDSRRRHGVVRRSGRGDLLVAWQPHGVRRFPSRDLGQLVIFGVAAFLTLFLGRLTIFEPPRAISLRWVLPALVLGVTLPIQVFFGLAMAEQSRRLLDKETFETHRRIEARLQQIDQNFSAFLQKIARQHQQALDWFIAGRTDPPPGGFTVDDLAATSGLLRPRCPPGLLSGYLFDELGSLTRVLRLPGQNQATDRQIAVETVKKLLGLVLGNREMTDFEDPFFVHFMRNLGWFTESKVLHSQRLQLLDLRTDPRRPQGLTGVFVTHDRRPLLRDYFRRVFARPEERGGLALALVSCDEGVLVDSLPRRFRAWNDGSRLGEKVLMQGQAMDARLTTSRGVPLLVTCMPGRNLTGYLLVGAVPVEGVVAAGARLRSWMLATLGAGFLLALASGWSLVTFILARLREIGRGLDLIAAHRAELKLACPDGDEFAELARGLEHAAVTLEEVYSSLPIQGTLVRAEPLAGPDYRVAGGFDPGADPGGDYMDAFPIGSDRYLLAIGDVFGEGWQTALLVASVRVALRLHVEQHPDWSAVALASALRDHFLRVRSVVKHMAFGLALLDRPSGRFEWLGAGICPPLLVRGGRPRFLPVRDPPLGAAVRRPFTVHAGTLEPGDALVLHTDGWVKTLDRQGHPLGFDPFAACVERAQNPDPDRMIAGVRTELAAGGFVDWVGDDRTILIAVRAAVGGDRDG
ncbi:MAG: serine/threonine-protein phosphatase [Candidatus Riflebacteria bacterium]|nr:serine/threonine-protein phosphatase [Candidatus Riflebacteria bacterium]